MTSANHQILKRGSAESTSSVATARQYVPSPFADTAEPASYSDLSVHSECDLVHLQQPASVASIDTSAKTYRTTELEKQRVNGPLFDSSHRDFVKCYQEPVKRFPNVSGSSLSWEPTSDVCEVFIHGRQPSFEKHSERVVPNPWRRFGPLAKLSVIGGFANKRKKSACYEVKPGAPKPQAPNAPEMALHRDPDKPLTFIYPPKNVPGEICAQNFALQIAVRAENSWTTRSWVNPKRLHFMEYAKSFAPSSAPVNATVPNQSRSRYPSDFSDVPTAVSGRFSTSSTTSNPTAVSGRFSTASNPTPRKAKKGKQ